MTVFAQCTAREFLSSRAEIGSMSPPGYGLSMVASLQSRVPFHLAESL